MDGMRVVRTRVRNQVPSRVRPGYPTIRSWVGAAHPGGSRGQPPGPNVCSDGFVP